MALVRRRVQNPVQPMLALVNGSTTRRSKNMATRKRRRSTRRRAHARNPINPINPTRRRRSSTRRRRHSVFARRSNPINPTRRRRHSRRRRNPLTGGLLVKGGRLALAGLAIGFIQPTVRGFVAPYVGTSPLASAGITVGTGWLVAKIASFIPFTKKYEEDILLAGVTLGLGQLAAFYAPRFGIGGGASLSGPRWPRRGMRGIGIATGIPPNVVPPLPPAPAANNGMQGIGMRNGQWGY